MGGVGIKVAVKNMCILLFLFRLICFKYHKCNKSSIEVIERFCIFVYSVLIRLMVRFRSFCVASYWTSFSISSFKNI